MHALRLYTILVVLGGAGYAAAAPIIVPVDPAQSVLNFELCVSGQCDTETAAVTGTVVIELDSVDIPTVIWLDNFDLAISRDLSWHLSWSFLGSLNAFATGVSLHDALPGVPLGPNLISAGGFTVPAVAANMTGTLSYSATGIPCLALQAAGRLCSDSENLANLGPGVSDWNGTLTTNARVVTLTTVIDQEAPLDPNTPALGSMHVTGTVRGAVLVPRPIGDVDGDGDVDGVDLSWFVAAMAGPGQTAPPPGVSAYHFAGSDLEGDVDVDLRDYGGLQRAQPI